MFIWKKYTQILLPQQVKRGGCAIIIFLMAYEVQVCSMENNGLGTKAIAMANAFVAVSDDCWGIRYNPAGLHALRDVQCSVFIVPGQFGMQELATRALSAVIPLSFATMGIDAVKFGYDLYSETTIGLACSTKLDENLAAGVNVEYDRIDIARYGAAAAILLHCGILVQLSENIRIGFSVHNVTAATLGMTGEKLPQVSSLGICLTPFAGFQMPIEIEKDIHFPASIKLGIEQSFYSTIALRAGIANNPDKYSIGCSFRYTWIEFGYAGYSHPDLGWTNQIDLTFGWAR